eukprot:1316506-Amorphochlora_amoeboformis.AAC.1
MCLGRDPAYGRPGYPNFSRRAWHQHHLSACQHHEITHGNRGHELHVEGDEATTTCILHPNSHLNSHSIVLHAISVARSCDAVFDAFTVLWWCCGGVVM